MIKILYFLLFLWSTGTNMVRRIFPAYLAGFVPSAFLISLVSTGYDIGKVFAIPCGIAVDKAGKVRSLSASFFLVSVIAVLISLTMEVFHFVVLFILIGIVSNFCYTSKNALISLQKRKTESFFRLESVYQFGMFLGPLIGGFIVSFYSMTLALYTWAILGLVGFGVSTLLLKGKVEVKRGSGFSGFFGQFGRDKPESVVVLVVGSLFTGFFFSLMNFTLPLYMIGIGMEIYHVGVMFAAGAVISSIGMYLLSGRFEKLTKEKALIIIMLMTGLSVLIMNYSFDIITLSLVFGIFTIGRASGLSLTRAFVSEKTSEGARSTGMAFVDTIHFGGGMLGPISAGLLIDFISIQWVFFMVFGISMFGLIIVLIHSLMGRKHAA